MCLLKPMAPRLVQDKRRQASIFYIFLGLKKKKEFLYLSERMAGQPSVPHKSGRMSIMALDFSSTEALLPEGVILL